MIGTVKKTCPNRKTFSLSARYPDAPRHTPSGRPVRRQQRVCCRRREHHCLRRALALWLLAGYLLFCHGCHGDDDNELLARIMGSTPAEAHFLPLCASYDAN